jgi:predicted small lipoprotein YifL
MRKLILLALISTMLAACGVKGPLYLPEKMYPQPPEPSVKKAPAQQQSPDSEPLTQPESQEPPQPVQQEAQ